MAEWLIEEGIGETRAIRMDGAEVTAARLEWPGLLTAGLVADAVLISRKAGSPRGTARFESGEDALVDRIPREASEGAKLRLKITRAAIAEGTRAKLAQARPTEEARRAAPTLAESLAAQGHQARVVRRFPGSEWDELMAEAASGEIAFDGGTLLLYPTPAMTLIDIDGNLPHRALALAAVPAIARALERLAIGGSIGIDFPTLSDKADRREIDEFLWQLRWAAGRTSGPR